MISQDFWLALAGLLAGLALTGLHGRLTRRAGRPRPVRRSRVAIRQDDYVRLYRQIDTAVRQLDELDAARARRSAPPVDWIAQVNACLEPEDDAA